MKDRFLHKRDIVSIYGLSKYEAQTLMDKLPKVNVGRGNIRPRWVIKQDDIESYLHNNAKKADFYGLDSYGKIIRRR